MFWADRVAKEIIASQKYKPYWVDDMKTLSGRIHVGSLRGVVVHELIYRALLDAGGKATFSYVFEDSDPMDGLPVYLDEKQWSKYLGQPLFTIPSPDGKAANYAVYFAQEFQDAFTKIGCNPEIIWTGDLYRTGKMNDAIKICLDSVGKIRKVYEEMYKKKLPNNWYPFQVVCPQCGKMSTTKVTGWDGEKVAFECRVDALDWTKGCNNKSTISPLSGSGKFVGKLSWKVEWSVKWKVIGVTIEGAGKDHMTAGGSHDIAKLICEKVLHYPVPYPIAYEFFLVGGKKMSSSKGLGTSAKEISDMLPPYLLRFLMVRTQIQHAIDFDPMGWTIPDLYDEYDRCWKAYATGGDSDLARIFELSQVRKVPEKENIFLPRFRTVAQITQFHTVDPVNYFEQEKGTTLTKNEKEIIRERLDYAQIWLSHYAPEEVQFAPKETLPEEVRKLTDRQRTYLRKLIELIPQYSNPEELGKSMYRVAQEMKLDTKDAFAAIYLAFLGKSHGPKAAALLLNLPREFVMQRLQEASESKKRKNRGR